MCVVLILVVSLCQLVTHRLPKLDLRKTFVFTYVCRPQHVSIGRWKPRSFHLHFYRQDKTQVYVLHSNNESDNAECSMFWVKFPFCTKAAQIPSDSVLLSIIVSQYACYKYQQKKKWHRSMADLLLMHVINWYKWLYIVLMSINSTAEIYITHWQAAFACQFKKTSSMDLIK